MLSSSVHMNTRCAPYLCTRAIATTTSNYISMWYGEERDIVPVDTRTPSSRTNWSATSRVVECVSVWALRRTPRRSSFEPQCVECARSWQSTHESNLYSPALVVLTAIHVAICMWIDKVQVEDAHVWFVDVSLWFSTSALDEPCWAITSEE